MSFTPETKVQIVNEDPANPGIVSIGPRPQVSQFLDVTHDWADKTTWWTHAIQKTDVTLTQDPADGTGKTFYYDKGGANPQRCWIDFQHGKIQREDMLHSARRAIVKDNGIIQRQRLLDETLGVDGVQVNIDYREGRVIFDAVPTGPVVATFYHVDESLPASKQSEFVLCAPHNRRLILERVEAQFTKGLEMKDDVLFAGFAPVNWIAVQSDNTLDPVALVGNGGLKHGYAFRIDDKDNLHANFGTIEGDVGNGDVVIYLTERPHQQPDAFVVWADVSEYADGDNLNAIDAQGATYHWNGASWVSQPAMPMMLEVPEGRDCYKTLFAFLDHATGNYSVVPANLVSGERGCSHDILQIPFNWMGVTHINYSTGAQLRVWLKDGKEFGPSGSDHRATATFYGIISD